MRRRLSHNSLFHLQNLADKVGFIVSDSANVRLLFRLANDCSVPVTRAGLASLDLDPDPRVYTL